MSFKSVTGKAAGTSGDVSDARAFRYAPVTADAPPGAQARPNIRCGCRGHVVL